jgi:hypothetical protein
MTLSGFARAAFGPTRGFTAHFGHTCRCTNRGNNCSHSSTHPPRRQFFGWLWLLPGEWTISHPASLPLANHNSHITSGIRSLQRSHCPGVDNCGLVQCRRCLANLYQWSSANRLPYTRHHSSRGGGSIPSALTQASHCALGSRRVPLAPGRLMRITVIGWWGEARKCRLLHICTITQPCTGSSIHSNHSNSSVTPQVHGSFSLKGVPCLGLGPLPR